MPLHDWQRWWGGRLATRWGWLAALLICCNGPRRFWWAMEHGGYTPNRGTLHLKTNSYKRTQHHTLTNAAMAIIMMMTQKSVFERHNSQASYLAIPDQQQLCIDNNCVLTVIVYPSLHSDDHHSPPASILALLSSIACPSSCSCACSGCASGNSCSCARIRASSSDDSASSSAPCP